MIWSSSTGVQPMVLKLTSFSTEKQGSQPWKANCRQGADFITVIGADHPGGAWHTRAKFMKLLRCASQIDGAVVPETGNLQKKYG